MPKLGTAPQTSFVEANKKASPAASSFSWKISQKGPASVCKAAAMLSILFTQLRTPSYSKINSPPQKVKRTKPKKVKEEPPNAALVRGDSPRSSGQIIQRC